VPPLTSPYSTLIQVYSLNINGGDSNEYLSAVAIHIKMSKLRNNLLKKNIMNKEGLHSLHHVLSIFKMLIKEKSM
jgi:hypothetical protein